MDIKSMTERELRLLASEIRGTLVERVAQNGGHLSSNLGTVELIIAIHHAFHTLRDRLVFDVGHQCYTHKILTGRGDQMHTLRTFGGLSGYPKPSESAHDAFVAGHASAAVSAALGMARARTILGEDYHVVALLGDGALTGGLAYEGLSDAGLSKEPLLVILNDNGMSITKNVGGVSQYLAGQRLKPQYLFLKRAYRAVLGRMPLGRWLHALTHKIKNAVKGALLPCTLFEDMGFTYLGPIDGHDIGKLIRILNYAKEQDGPVLLHVRTKKGKGYAPAEKNPDAFHGVSSFCPETGQIAASAAETFSDAFGKAMRALAREDGRICAITAAMQAGTGLDGFSREFPGRFFDVGIAEGHAVTMASGMAKQGLLPVFAVYSTFLQRAYDMLLHDTAILGLHVVFAVDRAGLVGEDGETHQGIFDVSFLSTVPGMTVLCPAHTAEVLSCLRYALYACPGPVALRYPRGCGASSPAEAEFSKAPLLLREGEQITLVGYGPMIRTLAEAADLLNVDGFSAEVIRLRAVVPLDTTLIEASAKKTGCVLIAEDCVQSGSVGEKIAARLGASGTANARVVLCNLGGGFVPHGTIGQLSGTFGLDARSLYQTARAAIAVQGSRRVLRE